MGSASWLTASVQALNCGHAKDPSKHEHGSEQDRSHPRTAKADPSAMTWVISQEKQAHRFPLVLV